MTPFNEAKLAAILADGRIIDVTIKNFGWQGTAYETRFEFEGVTAISRFTTVFYQPQFCSEPDVRFARDYECLEVAIEKHFGCALHDLEED